MVIESFCIVPVQSSAELYILSEAIGADGFARILEGRRTAKVRIGNFFIAVSCDTGLRR